ncbi:endonuclease/exonuclease/phosphatase family protein [Fulvivirga ulvae]|uniref:endonuclease/exonuclease/phosphatase family protein n=1 Tax=Fulvivirga ulvae TaxID=2904245 RepID=UPI001F3A6555|nr:endonuclease/exonuclease/phosphatase family protein [Fulvivirga ulvae]UII32478.1 endonuclease/exonuclease/phosphatase family protein [Fulvivirga ulvae]
MRRVTLTLLFMLSVSAYSTVIGQSGLKVMSYNVRYDNPSDADNGNGWKQRRDNVVKLIKHYNPDLLGVQEAMKHQLDYLLEELEGYDYIGTGRDDGKEKGEYSAILYKTSQFKLVEGGTFWLSQTPDKPSKAWDAALPRIATWAAFEVTDSHQRFYYLNTHFDHVGTEARANSAKLILEQLGKLTGAAPVVVSGDFNVTPDAEPYKILTSQLNDGRKESASEAYGPEGTFSGFELTADKDFPRIDYIFVKSMKVQAYETISDFFDDKFPSDHLPVMAVVSFDGK